MKKDTILTSMNIVLPVQSWHGAATCTEARFELPTDHWKLRLLVCLGLPHTLVGGAPIHPPAESRRHTDQQDDEHGGHGHRGPGRTQARGQQLYDRANLAQVPHIVRQPETS